MREERQMHMRNTRDFRYNREDYQYGSAAPAYNPRKTRPSYEERPGRRQAKNRKLSLNIAGITVVLAAFAFLAIVMVKYVQVQSEFTSTVKSVASKQVSLNSLTSSNDEYYSRIVSSVDIEDIESIARGELGMTYAQEGQIVTYSSAGNDYMRKVDSNN